MKNIRLFEALTVNEKLKEYFYPKIDCKIFNYICDLVLKYNDAGYGLYVNIQTETKGGVYDLDDIYDCELGFELYDFNCGSDKIDAIINGYEKNGFIYGIHIPDVEFYNISEEDHVEMKKALKVIEERINKLFNIEEMFYGGSEDNFWFKFISKK